MTKPKLSDLLAGDCLLYKPTSLMGLVIAVKTWHWVSHVEVYDCNGCSFASRDGVGVNRYPARGDGLCAVLRPGPAYDHVVAERWFEGHANGQGYDWLGLLVFTLAVKAGAKDRMFCSEFATRLYRVGGLEPFNPGEDADRIAPFQFLTSPAFRVLWRA